MKVIVWTEWQGVCTYTFHNNCGKNVLQTSADYNPEKWPQTVVGREIGHASAIGNTRNFPWQIKSADLQN